MCLACMQQQKHRSMHICADTTTAAAVAAAQWKPHAYIHVQVELNAAVAAQQQCICCGAPGTHSSEVVAGCLLLCKAATAFEHGSKYGRCATVPPATFTACDRTQASPTTRLHTQHLSEPYTACLAYSEVHCSINLSAYVMQSRPSTSVPLFLPFCAQHVSARSATPPTNTCTHAFSAQPLFHKHLQQVAQPHCSHSP